MSYTQTTIRVERRLYSQFKALCLLQEVSPTAMIAAWVKHYVEGQPPYVPVGNPAAPAFLDFPAVFDKKAGV